MHILRRLCSLKVYLVMHTVVRSLVMHRVVYSLKKYEYISLFPPHLGEGGGGEEKKVLSQSCNVLNPSICSSAN